MLGLGVSFALFSLLNTPCQPRMSVHSQSLNPTSERLYTVVKMGNVPTNYVRYLE